MHFSNHQILFILLTVFATYVHSHMVMKYPMSRGYFKNTAHVPVDYNIKDPLKSLVMCKGKTAGPVVASFKAGEIINVQLDGVARHGGGICQFAVSYDGDQTFYVIQEIDGGCPSGKIHALNALAFPATNIDLFLYRRLFMACKDT